MKAKSILVKTALAGVVKASAALIAFVMTAAITQILGAEESGLFLLAISILAFTSTFFRLGLNNVLLRLISADKGSQYSIGAMSTGLLVSVTFGFLFTLLIYLNSSFIANQLFSKAEFSNVLSTMIWALPFMLAFMVLASGFQAFYRVTAVTWFQNLGLSSLFLIFFAIKYAIYGSSILNLQESALLYLYAAITVCTWAVTAWHFQVKADWGVFNINNKPLWSSAGNLWVANTMTLAVQWSGVLIAGIFVSSSDVAYLSAAQRTAMLTSLILIVVNMVIAPRYARLWKQGDLIEIQNLSKWSTRGMIALALPVLVVMITFPDFIMSLFGAGFSEAGILLAIMAVGQFINVATGSVGYLLTMSGHEKDFRRVTFFSGPLTVVLSYFLVMEYGVLGAAIATAVGLSLQNLLALAMVRKRLNFWPIA